MAVKLMQHIRDSIKARGYEPDAKFVSRVAGVAAEGKKPLHLVIEDVHRQMEQEARLAPKLHGSHSRKE